MASPTTTTPYLDYSGVADRLCLTVPTVRRLVREEGLPAHRVARRVKFLADEVDAWLRARSGDQHPAKAVDDHRAAIKRLVDAAPPLTAEQAARIKAVLGSGAQGVA
ncbi:excisionase family DNA-binding protein [Mycolicibacterium sp. Y3]